MNKPPHNLAFSSTAATAVASSMLSSVLTLIF